MRRVGTHQPSSGQYPHSDRQTLSVDLRSRCLRHGRKGQERLAGYGRTIPRTLAEVFEHDTNDLFKRIGVDRSGSTWWCYRAVLGHLRAFLKHEYNLHDIALLELEQSFIEQYHVYLKTVCHLKAGSVCRYMDRWNNNVVKISFNNGLMPRNPFALYRYSAPTEPRTFLSEGTADFSDVAIEECQTRIPPRPVSLSCFTEICYKDMRYLTCEQIIPDTKGHLRMHGNRCKTGGEYMVKFLPADLRLLEKYRGTAPRRLHSICRDLPKSGNEECDFTLWTTCKENVRFLFFNKLIRSSLRKFCHCYFILFFRKDFLSLFKAHLPVYEPNSIHIHIHILILT